MKTPDRELLLGGGRKKFGKKKTVPKILIFFIFCFFLTLFYIMPMYKNYTSCIGYRCEYVYEGGKASERSTPPPGFLVHTPSCKIWDMNPFDKSVMKYIKRKAVARCAQAVVQVPDGGRKLIYNPQHPYFSTAQCCYRKVSRITQDDGIYNMKADSLFRRAKNCVKIPKDGIDTTDEFVQTECNVGDKRSSKTIVDYLAIPLSAELQSNRTRGVGEYWEDKLEAWSVGDVDEESRRNESQTYKKLPPGGTTTNQPSSTLLPPNVLIVGIDSISRMHMMRSLPKTREFLEENDFVEMQGYTKIGDNTFPNMMGVLNGMELNEWPCWGGKTKKMDDCPFIWKEFSVRKYVTAFLEDVPSLAIFNYLKTGFREQPVDYYLRPLAVAYSSNEIRKFNGCVSGLSQTEFILKYIKDFMGAMGGRVPYFLFSWFTSVGHDEFNNLKNYDGDYRRILENAVSGSNVGAENTITIFMSDHGYRFGSFRETFLGYYEESLPFFFIRLPPRIKQQHPEWYENLRRNAHRLVSPLDLHETFKNILTLSPPPSEDNDVNVTEVVAESIAYTEINVTVSLNSTINSSSVSKPKSQKSYYSFFSNIPGNRTCENSGITGIYCRCGVNPTVSPMSSASSKYSKLIIDRVNELLEPQINVGACVPLKLKKILYLREIGEGDVWNHFGKLVKYKDHLISLEASPSGAHFEAMVRTFPHNSTVAVMGDVSRTNSYQGQNDCLQDYSLKNYCMCKDVLDKKELAKKTKEAKEKAKNKKKKKG